MQNLARQVLKVGKEEKKDQTRTEKRRLCYERKYRKPYFDKTDYIK